jgi:hypothetical protein
VGVIDRAVASAVVRAGAPEDVAYTERQLYYETCRVLLPAHRLPRRPRFTVPAPVPYGRFVVALDRYRERRGEPPGLLAGSLSPPVIADGGPSAADLFDYGLPRLLVCQHADIAAMLLANELHMEAACAIVSAGVSAGVPLPDPLRECLARTGAPEVSVLHDADVDGLALAAELPARLGLPASARVTALGLRPVHAAGLHLAVPRGGAAEVAAVNPARLLRTLRRLMFGARRTRPPLVLRRERAVGFLTWPER